jgi:sterol desaturase/sphingolipid hydroxylase (fatty acid hydroxylase superfamily)
MAAYSSWYARLYETRNFPICLSIWLLAMPYMLQDLKNPWDGNMHNAVTYIKAVSVSFPIVGLLPGLLEFWWLPKDRRSQFFAACKKTFVANFWNIVPAALVMHQVYTKWTDRSSGPCGWEDIADFVLLLCSHEIWFYICHRINHWEPIYNMTHGHHHLNKGHVFMVNNADVDVWEMAFQGLWGLAFPLLVKPIRMYTHLAAVWFFFMYTCTIHSSVLRPGTLHGVHHEYGRVAYNYGLYTPLMDMLFGTYKSSFVPVSYKAAQPRESSNQVVRESMIGG